MLDCALTVAEIGLPIRNHPLVSGARGDFAVGTSHLHL